jgi:hypothetical protein
MVLEKRVDDILARRREKKYNRRNILRDNLRGVGFHYPEMKEMKR